MGEEEGFIYWNELMVDEPDKAWDFYSRSFGWQGEPSLILSGGRAVGAIVKRPAGVNLAPAWRPHIVVKDLSDKQEIAESLGAKIWIPKQPWRQEMHRSLIEDPSGASIFLVEL